MTSSTDDTDSGLPNFYYSLPISLFTILLSIISISIRIRNRLRQQKFDGSPQMNSRSTGGERRNHFIKIVLKVLQTDYSKFQEWNILTQFLCILGISLNLASDHHSIVGDILFRIGDIGFVGLIYCILCLDTMMLQPISYLGKADNQVAKKIRIFLKVGCSIIAGLKGIILAIVAITALGGNEFPSFFNFIDTGLSLLNGVVGILLDNFCIFTILYLLYKNFPRERRSAEQSKNFHIIFSILLFCFLIEWSAGIAYAIVAFFSDDPTSFLDVANAVVAIAGIHLFLLEIVFRAVKGIINIGHNQDAGITVSSKPTSAKLKKGRNAAIDHASSASIEEIS